MISVALSVFAVVCIYEMGQVASPANQYCFVISYFTAISYAQCVQNSVIVYIQSVMVENKYLKCLASGAAREIIEDQSVIRMARAKVLSKEESSKFSD